MRKKEIEFRDPVVERVVDSFVARSNVGWKKYGITLDSDPQEVFAWMQHLQEELMDAVLYLQKAKEVYMDQDNMFFDNGHRINVTIDEED